MALSPSQRWFPVILIFGGLISGWVISGGWSQGHAEPQPNCHTYYRASIDLLDAATEKALNHQHPDEDAFAVDFQKQVGKLQAEKCMPELMNLLQHIEAQKKKYSSTPSSTAQGGAKP